MSEELSTSRAFQYSVLLHALFVVLLVLSWGHVPEPESVRVSLWSSQEVAEARQGEVSQMPPKTHAVTHPPVHKVVHKPVEHPREEKPVSRSEPRNEPDIKEEKSDIQIERKKTHKHKHREQKPVVQPEEQHPQPKAHEKRISKPEPKEILKPVTKPKPILKPKRTEENQTASENLDDKAKWIESHMGMTAPVPAHTARISANPGERGASKASRVGGHQGGGMECSQIGDYCDRVKRKVRGNIDWPDNQDVPSMAVFEVTLLPDGELGNIVLKQRSGDATYDASVERAIKASSPFPRPMSPEQQVLILRFKPS